MADDAGALLVRSGLVTASSLDEARARVGEIGGTIGEQLVANAIVTDDALTDFYKTRLLVPQVNPNTLARLPIKVIGLIPNDMAIELRVVPVSIDAENNLTVAMSDPSDRHAVDEIAFFTGAYVVRAVATQMQIAWCLAHYYGHVTNLGQRLLKPEPKMEGPELSSGPGIAAKPAEVAAAVKPPQRTRGITGEVEAMRHRGLVPGEASVESSKLIADVEELPAPSDGKIDGEQGRSVSGEIRINRRAPSIRPPFPEDSGPVITMEADESVSGPEITIEAGSEQSGPSPRTTDDEDTGRALPAPRRRRPAEPDPPELAARAGEVDLQSQADREVGSGPSIVIDELLDEASVPEHVEPSRAGAIESAGLRDVSGEIAIVRERQGANISVEITDEDSAPVMIHESLHEPSAPILLDRKRPSDPPPVRADQDDEGNEVVSLGAPKKATQPMQTVAPPRRHERRTSVGIGVPTRPKHDTIESVPAQLEDDPTGEHKLADAIERAIDADPTRVDMVVAPNPDDASSDEIAAPPSPIHHDDTSPLALPPKPGSVPPPSGRIELSNVKRAPSVHEDDEDDEPQPDIHGGKPTIVMPVIAIPLEDDDEGWGAPGTTIPPPFLGAIPGVFEPRSGVIPLPDFDAQPLMVAPPSPPEHTHTRAHTTTEAGVARALEQATMRVLSLIRDLEHAQDRDEVVAVMIAHLAETHRRAGFFAVRSSELSLFSITPNVVPLPWQTVKLDRPSTLADIVGTRLPYRGPMHDAISRAFLEEVLGVCPPEILLVPITVRERVVGVLFGEHRMRHTFDDQLALASRAAGDALERILRAKRG
ncbi:MAG: hypothetical protein ABI678_00805 [Kofleriaceae bacterium]